MKVMSYNLLFGGFDGLEARRHHAQVELINKVQPDILLVQEAKNFDMSGQQFLFNTEKQINMRGFIAQSEKGQHTGIFIRHPIKPLRFETDAAHFHHAKAVLVVEAPGFSKPLTVISTHLCPYGPELRVNEAYYLAKHARDRGFVLIGGDLNSTSPFDQEPPLPAGSHMQYRVRHHTLSGKPDTRSLEILNRAGYIDIAHKLHKHFIHTVPATGFDKTEFIPARFDYILTSQELAEYVVQYDVIKDELSDTASDHYPVVAEFGMERR